MLEIQDGFFAYGRVGADSTMMLHIDALPAATMEISEPDGTGKMSFGAIRRPLFRADAIDPVDIVHRIFMGEEMNTDRTPFFRLELLSSLEQVETFVKELIDSFLPPLPEPENQEDREYRDKALSDLVGDIMRRVRGEAAYWQAHDAEPVPATA